MRNRQAGFTFIELITASAASGVLMLAASAFLIRAIGWYDELGAKIEINRHAREAFAVLALGGRATSNGNDASNNVYGLRGRRNAPASGLRNNYALHYSSNNLVLAPDSIAPMSVDCVSTFNPLPDCGTGTRTVQGWMGSDVQLNMASRSVLARTVEVTMTIVNPYQIQRAEDPTAFADTYRSVFMLNRDEADP